MWHWTIPSIDKPVTLEVNPTNWRHCFRRCFRPRYFFVAVAIIKILPRTFLILCDYLSDIVARNCLRVKIAKYLKKIQKWFPCLFLFMQEHGADLTATNNEGQTAMSLAVGVGNKNGKFTFIDFQWLSFWVALNGFKTNVTHETVSGPPSRPMGRRSRWQKQQNLLSYGPVAWTCGGGRGRNFNDGVSLGPYIRKRSS